MSDMKRDKISAEKSLEMFVDNFLELHPKTSLPKWFKYYFDFSQIHSNKPNMHRFAMMALKKRELSANESYEEYEGKEFLAKVDPDLGERRYVINTQPSEVLVVFEVEIDSISSELNILTDVDLESIDPKGLRRLRNIS